MKELDHLKGCIATVTVPVAGVAAWLSVIDVVGRIAVSIAGIAVAYYAARYWRERTRRLGTKKEDDSL